MIVIYLALYVTLLESARGANILYVAPFPSLSHYQMIEPLMLNLAQRGHHVTVLSHFPQRQPVTNYRDISLRGTVSKYELGFTQWGLIEDAFDIFKVGAEQCEGIVSSSVVQNFLNEDHTFDLIFLEMLDSDCYLGFVKRYNAPYILCSSAPLTVWHSDWLYNPTEASYVPDSFCRVGGKMDALARLQNVMCQALYRITNYWYNTLPSVKLVRKHFRISIDTLEDIKQNVSMILVNSHRAITPVRPLLPNIVEVGGIHIRPPKPLNEKIEAFLSESKDGAIVFSMGSMVKAYTVKAMLREIFIEVFGRLKQRVLCKWETGLENRPENVMIVDWLPQSDVVGHEKVKLFISHGGIHGIMEAIHCGVPILGIPLYGDQMTNVKNLEDAGAAMQLDLQTITADGLYSAIHQLLNNKTYAENARRLSRIMREQPVAPLDLAIFWTEYVLRNGAPPRPSISHLSWFSYLFIDVWLITILILVIFFSIFRFSLKMLAII